MSDPVRWRSAEGGGPSGARELLLKAKAPKALGGAAKAQHAAMLAKVVAAGAAAPATTAAVAGVKLGLSAKVVVGLAVAVTATGVGVTRVREARRAREESVVSAPARPTPPVRQVTETATARVPEAPAVVETVPTETAVPVPVVAAPSVTVAASTETAVARSRVQPRGAMQARVLPGGTTVATTAGTGVATPVVQAPTLAPEAAAPTPAVVEAPVPPRTESELLHDATVAMPSNPTQALALVHEHETRYGAINAESRRVLEVRLLCRLGRTAEARSVATALIADNPDQRRLLPTGVHACLGW